MSRQRKFGLVPIKVTMLSCYVKSSTTGYVLSLHEKTIDNEQHKHWNDAVSIALTEFASRHWDQGVSGTKIVGLTPDELVARCNAEVNAGAVLVEGYAPFCRHLFLKNTTKTRCGFAPIAEENTALLKSGYVARRDGELPVLERWFEGLVPPTAAYLDVILYDREQLASEAAEGPDDGQIPDCDWGIVSVIGTLSAVEPPMPPITQMRNSLGKGEGGSGVAIDRTAYAKAVEFWENHASVR